MQSWKKLFNQDYHNDTFIMFLFDSLWIVFTSDLMTQPEYSVMKNMKFVNL